MRELLSLLGTLIVMLAIFALLGEGDAVELLGKAWNAVLSGVNDLGNAWRGN